MDLHLCESIDELNKLSEHNLDKLKNRTSRQLISSADKLLKTADEWHHKGDMESSYVCYMKYLNVVSLIKKHPEYKKDEKYFISLLGPKNVREAITKAENLNKKLRERYEAREKERRKHEEEKLICLKEDQTIKEHQDSFSTTIDAPNALSHGISFDSTSTFTSWSLDAMIKQKAKLFVIFDVRSAADFANSHIKHHSCFSVPEEIIKPGLSAALLFKQLPENTRAVWKRRLDADVIVLVDWFGQDIPGTAIYFLKEIMTKWDPSSTYKGSIKVLSGGYDDWLIRFPFQTTNPHISSATKVQDSILLPSVDDIDYPDFDLPYPETRISEINSFLPTVNRATKPTLERTQRDQISEMATNIENFTETALHHIPLEVETRKPPAVTKNATPAIDRNLKQKAILNYLQDEENMVEKSLALAQEQLDKEKEWEKLRLEREVSANSEITAQLLQREEQMIEAFKKLESEKMQQEMEITQLREQLSQLRARDEKPGEPVAKSNKEHVTIQARISDKELEKKKMYQEVELLRELRKQKESIRSKATIPKANVLATESPKPKFTGNSSQDTQATTVEPARRNFDSVRHTGDHISEKKTPSPTKTFCQVPLSNGMGSKINRSHSTPDLAQVEQDQASKVPSFERALKPVISNTRLIPRPDLSRNRNFDPVYGSMGRGLTGLKNLGNTCYMNSVIQCISNCALLTNFLVDGSYRAFLNSSNKATRGEITDEISSVLKAIWCGQYRSISCKDFKNTVGKYESSFSGYQQQDSHEFLTILVDWLHEELNDVREKRPLKEQNNKNIPLEKAALMAWQDYKSSNESIIVNLFGGQQRSTVQCLSCNEESVTFEPFFNLSLPIPQSKNHCSLKDCFALYTIPEQVSGWSCPFCKQNKAAKKKIDIWKLPPVLVVHLQRFYNDGMWRKRLTMVEFSVNELDLGGIVKSNSSRYTRFNLFAVSNHYGTMDAGHYTAYCKNPEYNKWFKFDDQDVMEINGNEVRSAAAYILFYSAIDYEPPKVVQEP